MTIAGAAPNSRTISKERKRARGRYAGHFHRRALLRSAPVPEEWAMKTERQKMLAGELYDPLDPELVAARAHARDLAKR